MMRRLYSKSTSFEPSSISNCRTYDDLLRTLLMSTHKHNILHAFAAIRVAPTTESSLCTIDPNICMIFKAYIVRYDVDIFIAAKT